MPLAFTDPLPFDEALERRAVQALLPTRLRTAELAQIQAEIRERAFFSAQVDRAEILDSFSRRVDQTLSGELSSSEAVERLRTDLESIGYTPAQAAEGGLEDLSSLRRRRVVIETNVALAQGYGQRVQGTDPDVLDAFPAQELVRIRNASEPRDWRATWRENGGSLPGGRMVALKTDPIWTRISRFGYPYPPFDFGSGMGLEDVDRDEAERLGLIAPSETPRAPEQPRLNEGLRATPQVQNRAVLDSLIRSLGGRAALNAAGELVLRGGAA